MSLNVHVNECFTEMVAGGKCVLFKQELRITFQVIMWQKFIMGNYELIILTYLMFHDDPRNSFPSAEYHLDGMQYVLNDQ